MATPEYVLRLRESVGHELLVLPGVSAVIVREGPDGRELLLVRRSDNGQWTPVTGIADPGEDVDTAAVRGPARAQTRAGRIVCSHWSRA